MRILQAVRDMHPREGGPPRVVAGAAAALAHQGHDVTIFATMRAGEEGEVRAAWRELAAAGVALRLFPASAPRALGGSRALAAAVGGEIDRFDVAHLHGVWDQCLIAIGHAARGARVPYLVSPHGMLDRWSMARSRWKKQLVLRFGGGRRFLAGAVALAYGTADEAGEAEVLGLPGTPLVVPNGVDPALLGERDLAARARLHAALPQTAGWSRTVLFYSRLHPKKGLDLLVDAFAEIAPAFPGAGLLAAAIPQDAVYGDAVRAQAAAAGLGDRIIVTTDFAGPDSRYLLDAADLFVLPSHQEGFSMAIVEAMARGLPMLITDRCHLPEVESQGAGRVVAPDARTLAGGLRALLALDDAALAEMGGRGAALVAERYTWPQIALRLGAAYAAARAG